MHILVANDDGVTTSGIAVFYDALADHVDCVVVVPGQDKSGASSSLALDRPLHPQHLDNGSISLNGTPTDCAYLGLNDLLEELPDMVASDINLGTSLGDDILYSDTVAAAIEGCFLKGPTFAFSLVLRLTGNLSIAMHPVRLLVSAHGRLAAPPRTVFSVSIPDPPLDRIHGIQLTRLGHRARIAIPVRVANPHGKEDYWIATAGDAEDGGPGTDFHTVVQGYVLIILLQLGRTLHGAFDDLDGWLGGLT